MPYHRWFHQQVNRKKIAKAHGTRTYFFLPRIMIWTDWRRRWGIIRLKCTSNIRFDSYIWSRTWAFAVSSERKIFERRNEDIKKRIVSAEFNVATSFDSNKDLIRMKGYVIIQNTHLAWTFSSYLHSHSVDCSATFWNMFAALAIIYQMCVKYDKSVFPLLRTNINYPLDSKADCVVHDWRKID